MTQITELKRQLSQRVPYEELMTKAEVTRLSNDLHSLRSRSRSKSRRRRPEPTDDVRRAIVCFGWVFHESRHRHLLEFSCGAAPSYTCPFICVVLPVPQCPLLHNLMDSMACW